MIIQPWVSLLQSCPIITMPKGTKLFHGARRAESADWIQDVMWMTLSESSGKEYMQRDAEKLLRRKLMTFQTKRDMKLLDWSSLSGPKLSDMAQAAYGTSVVGAFDEPIRHNLLQTARIAKSDYLDGCMKWRGDEVLLDNVLTVLSEI
ncbi:hypothetical protein AAKU58_000249 [Oxalobacteraceae bacterium GrIS 1.18]